MILAVSSLFEIQNFNNERLFFYYRNLNALKKGLDDDSNLLPLIIDCVRNHCTLGEICSVMKEVHGEHI